MSLQVEKLDNNMAKLTIEVSVEEVDKAIQGAYLKQRGSINVPGFRKGKVPRQMVEKMYGVEIFYDDAANAMIPEAYSNAYDESKLDIVSQPTIDVVQLEKSKPFIFTAEVALKPEVTLGEYKGIEVDKVVVEATSEEVEAELKSEQEKNARTITVEDRAVVDGDEVILDFEGFVDEVPFEGGKGENHSLVIGSNSFIPGFEEQLIGVETDTEVKVNVKFPDDYHSEELKGKEAIFVCTVHEIKVKELPELDDEFASEVSEFDTLEAYKSDVEKKIVERKTTEAKREKEDKVLEVIIENAKMDIPEPMIDTQVKQMAEDFSNRIQQQGLTLEQYFQFTGMTNEKMLEELKPQAVKRIQTRLVLEAIAKAEDIKIAETKFDEELEKMAKAYNMEVDKIKEFMGDNEKEQMQTDLAVQEAVTLVTDAAVEK